LLPRFAPRNERQWGWMSLRGFPKGSRGNLGSQTKGLRTVLANANLYEIAFSR